MKKIFSFCVLILMGISLHAQNAVVLNQNNPNPFKGNTEVYLSVSNPGEVRLIATDLYGTVQTQWSEYIEPGVHSFCLTLRTKGNYVLGAYQNEQSSSIIMFCNEGGETNTIVYNGKIDEVDAFDPEYSEAEMVADIDEQTEDFERIVRKQSKKVQVSDFRVALSLSPFSFTQFKNGYSFIVGDKTATTPADLQKIYRDLGSTEMYCRIATKRHVTATDITDGEYDSNANFHTLDQGLELCKIAAALDIPINPEIMCAYTYMDMDRQQAPRFDEYPEIYALQNGKEWSELSLDEICTVLEAYGKFVAKEILNTKCTVKNWNLGNEANYGFAGISMGLKTAVNPKLKKSTTIGKYLAPLMGVWWLKKNVWKYDAKAYLAVKNGILSAYDELNIDASDVKFSTHIATVVSTPRCSAAFFKCMAMNGYVMETAGISYYPSAPAMTFNKKKMLKRTISKINKKCEIPVFIGEFSYPSGKMSGDFAGWNKKLKGYSINEQGQQELYTDVLQWGKSHGMAGIRYWAPDYEGWYTMSMFEFKDKTGVAKPILTNHKQIVK